MRLLCARVDAEDHTLSAVVASPLLAVEPCTLLDLVVGSEGFGRLTERLHGGNLHLEDWSRADGVVWVGHQVRVHGSRGHLDTGLAEGGLGDGMVLRHKAELNHITNGSRNSRWGVNEPGFTSNDDLYASQFAIHIVALL